MNIVFIENYRDEPRGGIRSLNTLYKELSAEHECKLIWRGGRGKDIEDSHVGVKEPTRKIREFFPVEMKDLSAYIDPLFNRELSREVKKHDPDLIITQNSSSYFATKYCRQEDTKTLVFLRAWELLYEKEGYHKGNMMVSRIVNRVLRSVNKKIADYLLRKADLLVSNSEFTSSRYEKAHDVSSEIVYPFVDMENYCVDQKGDKILHVNPAKKKGIELTLDVASRMPEQDFILAGTTEDSQINQKIRGLENVESLGYIDDMKKAYRQTKIVIMPSKWKEPYGRIPIEAGASGIPAIATDKGGLPESVGTNKLLVDYSPEKFIQKIKEIKENYQEFSEEALKNAEQKKKQKQVQKLKKIISSLD